MSVFPHDVRFGIAVGVVAFALVLITSADANGDVEVGLFTESVSVSVSGPIDLGGPHGSGVVLRAHHNAGAQTAPAVLTNTGNIPLNAVYVSYSNEQGMEAACDGGDASWQAVSSSSPGEDQFRTRVWVSQSVASTYTAFNHSTTGAKVIPPGSVSANVLDPATEPIGASDTAFLMLDLIMPSPAVAGSDGCFIGLTLTVAAEE